MARPKLAPPTSPPPPDLPHMPDVGSALTAWDVANAKRHGVAVKVRKATAPQKSGPGLGSIIAIILGAAAAVGVLYAAWQTLRADDELWVADDPLAAPDA